MADLRTDYKDDVLDTSQNINRTFSIIDNTTGTVIYPNVSLEETTVFTQEGDIHSASVTNAQNEAINQLNNDLSDKADKTDVVLYPDVSQDFVLICENTTLNYTAPANGFVSFISNTNTPVAVIITINDKQVVQITSGVIPVKRGQVVKSSGSIRLAHFTYSV